MASPDNTTGEGSSSGSSAGSAQRDPIASQLEQIKALLQQQSQTLDACLAQQLQKDVDIDRRRAEVDERDEQLRAQVAELMASRPLRGPTHPSDEEIEAEHEALLRYIRQEHESRKAMIRSTMSGKNATHNLSKVLIEVVSRQSA
ncbi:hypothetical protein EYR40_009295 [Pleurotus pulmonarius]|nr:hypothetical protein EYR36_005335 [Pleurotus pulmonarius]KAF4590314.1 hypothetical protein EYR38_009613 [Pleurotus pulmonarius]KAF4590699.1 hypothetical protein EYR40_009295 [Pleurotus pulmonarius]